MKFPTKIIFTAFAAILMLSCESVVDIEQPGRLDADAAYETVSDLEGGLLAAYNQMDYTSIIYFNSVFTDEISISVGNGGQGLGGLYAFRLNTASTAARIIWTKWYDVANYATRVIVGAQNVKPEQGEQAAYNAILGQAYALRAFAHFTLMTYFAENLTDDSSLGVIIVDEVPKITDDLPRSTVGEVFQFINADLDKAAQLMPASLNENAYRLSPNAVTALRARMALYRQNYQAAEQYSQQLLDKLDLADRQEYYNMYVKDTRGEVIFKFNRTVGATWDRQSLPGGNGTVIAGGWVGAVYSFVSAKVTEEDGDVSLSLFYEMSRSLYNLLDKDDIRYKVDVHPSSIINENYPNIPSHDTYQNTDIISIGKYRGNVPGEAQPLMNDIKIFRVSEMLLINAEAEAALGNLGEAALLIQKLRNTRYSTPQPLPIYNSKQEAFADILKARRIELAFEGHRWVDLGRLGARANVGIDRAPLDCEFYDACEGPVPGETHKYRMPIPQVELDANHVITQNPGY